MLLHVAIKKVKPGSCKSTVSFYTYKRYTIHFQRAFLEKSADITYLPVIKDESPKSKKYQHDDHKGEENNLALCIFVFCLFIMCGQSEEATGEVSDMGLCKSFLMSRFKLIDSFSKRYIIHRAHSIAPKIM